MKRRFFSFGNILCGQKSTQFHFHVFSARDQGLPSSLETYDHKGHPRHYPRVLPGDPNAMSEVRKRRWSSYVAPARQKRRQLLCLRLWKCKDMYPRFCKPHLFSLRRKPCPSTPFGVGQYCRTLYTSWIFYQCFHICTAVRVKQGHLVLCSLRRCNFHYIAVSSLC